MVIPFGLSGTFEGSTAAFFLFLHPSCLALVSGDGGFIEDIWEWSFLFSLLEEFEKGQCMFFFVCSVEYTCEAICSWISCLIHKSSPSVTSHS